MKKTVLFVVIGAVALSALLGICLFTAYKWQKHARFEALREPYEAAAIAYLASDPDVIERYGEDVGAECAAVAFLYQWSESHPEFHLYPQTEEEFTESIEVMEITVHIGKIGIFLNKITGDECIVRFEKDEMGDLVIVGLEWD